MVDNRVTLPPNGFTFKQFFVAHDRCAMKVSTDAIILGCWAEIGQPQRILDIGTGCGIIALMMAQRSGDDVPIDAVELEADACLQARENFLRSHWSDRMAALHQDIHSFAAQTERRYDVIVSNPPYFTKGVDCYTHARNQARYTTTLTHENLLNVSKNLLTERGRLYLVLPYAAALNLLSNCPTLGWFFGKRLAVRDADMKPYHLLLVELALYPIASKKTSLTIRDGSGRYSEEYRRLANEFYLAF